MNDVILAQYNEVALKLGHRSMFVGRLLQNVRASLKGLPTASVRSRSGRLVVELGSAAEDEVLRRLRVQPGLANLIPARRCRPEVEDIERTAAELIRTWRPPGSFRVDVRRADKNFPVKSPELAARIGAMAGEVTGAPVDLKSAPSVLRVIISREEAWVATSDRIEGAGGLPASTAGRVLLLLSGGIDSPVAGLRMMRRGCRLDAIHFHSAPFLDRTSQEKARRLAAVLARGQTSVRLSLIAFGEMQSDIVRTAPQPLRVVLYRRMMMRIASEVARVDLCSGLVTGESLGQVASQTLANMAVIESAARLPVLRPLVGMEKLEITRYARRNDTYRISVVPDQDCCTLFVPRHPATGARLGEVEAAERSIAVDAMVEKALAERVRERIHPEWELDGQSAAAEL